MGLLQPTNSFQASLFGHLWPVHVLQVCMKVRLSKTCMDYNVPEPFVEDSTVIAFHDHFSYNLNDVVFLFSGVYNESTNEIITGGVGNVTVSKF